MNWRFSSGVVPPFRLACRSLLLALAACAPAVNAPAPPAPPALATAPPPAYALEAPRAQAIPPTGYAPPPAYAPVQAPVAATASAPATPPSRPLLPPLIGPLAWQTEIRNVLAEDVASLAPENQARVRGVPLVFDPNPFEVNAYAACDAHGSPSIVGTEGLLEAIDAIAQTKATDELYGTRTYDQYLAAVVPNFVQLDKASAALPLGIIPLNVVADPRRWSRAHEWFDEIVAFTFGHELSHHWLGHTGCAGGTLVGLVPAFLSRGGHTFVQPAENQADNEGTNTMLAAGKARAPQFRWTEEGALALLDFFVHLEDASGQTKVAFLATHPSSHLRIPWVQISAGAWHLQHPG